jgi:hypothetical protein
MASELNSSISVKLKKRQRLKLDYLSERNHDQKPTALIRALIDLGSSIAEQNGGLIPLPENVSLMTALTRRANRDRRRS